MSGLHVSARVAARALDVELAVAPGEVLAVLGPNGAGKSTLLDVIAGMLPPDAGAVRLDGRVLTDTARGIAVPPHRRDIGLLAQEALLFPHLSVLANVAFGPRSNGLRGRAAERVAREWLRAVDAEEFADRAPGSLSGGQAQRVALARALAVRPRVLLLDEPMAALDVTVAPAMRALLRRVLRDSPHAPTGTVLVTHDMIDALTLADRLVVIESGRVVESGPVAAVLARPRSAFAARIAGMNLVVGQAVAAADAADPVHAVDAAGMRVHGCADAGWTPTGRAAAVFAPTAVAVYREQPEGSPRNVFPVRIAELTDRGGIIRVRADLTGTGRIGRKRGDAAANGVEASGPVTLTADLTPGAVADLRLDPDAEVYFSVKAAEVQVYPC
ncbi:ATP-binding cassette domain-containing protein [Nocardia otitidiscaviarum]|uniref:sulfate/molybdate ABC transporter ATP-binding protein n=1 Tax=Nocardia otitidiscaviarum TaxID=1823 RepID=UPI0004A6DE15|nr:ATP-binding cassette domain-containing protein [Nocardia otitidiscaviarum]MBF6135810.1 ATP-binding cassette domain-containing protein [Nocardia otitidiscaviarum]MBF6483623.1 ATP-binding cassette domain-containing protein [Nocardia otitidiscaviarum]